MNEIAVNKRFKQIEQRQTSHEHQNELEFKEIKNKNLRQNEKLKALLDSNEWIKRAIIKGIISIVGTIIGTVVIATGAVIWGLIVNQ